MAKHGGGKGGGDVQGYSNAYRKDFDSQNNLKNTNLPETDEWLRFRQNQQRYENREEQARAEAANMPQQVHMLSIGKFIVPKTVDGEVDHSFAAQNSLIENEKNKLGFDPERYDFDKILAEKFSAIIKPENAMIQKHAAIIRNATIGYYLSDDESFDPGDEKYAERMKNIATALGDALSNDAWYKKPFFRSLSVEVANAGDGAGAQAMYEYLLSLQDDEPGYFSGLKNNLKELLDMPVRDWQLPPLDDMPFSDANLSAPPAGPATGNAPTKGSPPPGVAPNLPQQVKDAVAATPSPVAETPQTPAPMAVDEDMHGRIIIASERLTAFKKKLKRVDEMEEPPKGEAVEEARKILRFLKNLQSTDMDVEEWLDRGTPEAQRAKSDALQQLAQSYAAQLKDLRNSNPELVSDPAITEATLAAGAIFWLVAEHRIGAEPDNQLLARELEDIIKDLPPESELRLNQSVDRLVETVERGLERTSGKNLTGKSSAERLLEMGKRISAHARELRSVESMEPPVREEAVERAREILRGWKIQASDRSLDGLSVEEKETSARQFEEFAETYKNMVYEAAQDHPQLLQDPQIKDAMDAIGQFGHSVKLMAAKEMPGSIAAAQQISSEAAEDPAEWKNMSNNIEDRLKAGMGALEKASVSQAQEQQEEQAAEEGQDMAAINEQLQQAEQQKKKKRRRRSSSGSTGKPSKASSRKALRQMTGRMRSGDMNADGVDDALQALKNDRKVSNNPAGFKDENTIKGLKADAKTNKADPFKGLLNNKDMEVVLSAAGALQKANNQLKDLPAVDNVSVAALNEQGFAQRNNERDKMNQQNKGNQLRDFHINVRIEAPSSDLLLREKEQATAPCRNTTAYQTSLPIYLPAG